MRCVVIFFLALAFGLRAGAASAPGASPNPQQPQASAKTQTEHVEAPKSPRETPARLSSASGDLDPAQVAALVHKIWLAQYRVNDLLTEVHPERWKLSAPARASFDQTLEALRASLGVLEERRGLFEKRTDNMYLGYQTYEAMTSILPRLDGVGHGISQYENASLGAQYGQSVKQFADLQQTLGDYLALLLRNQDQVIQALENNVAGCENTLTYAMRPKVSPAKALGNAPAIRPERRRSRAIPRSAAASSLREKQGKKRSSSGQATTKKPAKPPTAKPEKKKKP